MFADALRASITLGLPVFAFTYLLHLWALNKGHLSPYSHHDEIEEQLDAQSEDEFNQVLNGDLSSVINGADLTNDEKPKGFIMENWLQFGGGFYGTIAFFTYAYIEILEIIEDVGKVMNMNFRIDAIIQVGISFIIDSIMNFFKALGWFLYWPNTVNPGNQFLWLAVIYAAYAIAAKLANGSYKKRSIEELKKAEA